MKRESIYRVVILVQVTLANCVECARPIYNIAHMVNTRSEIDNWMSYGANAIENDVTFADNGTPEYLYHGFPCDFGRNCWQWDRVPGYIEAIRERTIPSSPKFNPKLVLIVFDLKLRPLDKTVLKKAGEKFADVALLPLFSDETSKLKAMLTIQDVSQQDFITGLLAHLEALKRPDILAKIGFDSEKNLADPEDLGNFFKRTGVTSGHVWLSAGNTNWFIPFLKNKITRELESLVQYRDNGDGYVSKVYAWTVNLESTSLAFLKTGIDGFIANNPKNVNKAMESFNHQLGEGHDDEKLRLATLKDNPFKRAE